MTDDNTTQDNTNLNTSSPTDISQNPDNQDPEEKIQDTFDAIDDAKEKLDVQIPDEARKFLEAILDETGLTLTDEVRDEMVRELFLKLDALLMGRVIDALPDDKVDAFMDLQEDSATPEQIQAFIDENLPNSKDIFAASFAEFRDLYLTNVDIAVAEKEVADASQPSGQKDPLEEIAAGKHDSMQ